MAKYEIAYTCGHEGTRTVELFGKNADREWKLKRMGQECLCPECYKAKMAAKRATDGVWVTLQAAMGQDRPRVMLIARGDTYPIKDELKERGYKWSDAPVGRNFLLATMGKSDKAWVRYIDVDWDKDGEYGRGFLEEIADEGRYFRKLNNFNAEKSEININIMDANWLKSIRDKVAR